MRTICVFFAALGILHGAELVRPLAAPRPPFGRGDGVAEEKEHPVEWSDGVVAAGDKRLILTTDGLVRYLAGGREIGQFTLPFSLVDGSSGKPQWIAPERNFPSSMFSPEQPGLAPLRDSSLVCTKVLHVGAARTEIITSLTLRPDGLVLLSYRWKPFEDAALRLEPRTVILSVPVTLARDSIFELDGNRHSVPGSGGGVLASARRFQQLELFCTNPAYSLVLRGTEHSGEARAELREKENALWFRISERAGETRIDLLIDIQRGLVASHAGPVYGGIDFKAVDDLEMPDYAASLNLFLNPSFEQGLSGYNRSEEEPFDQQRGIFPFVIDSAQALFDVHSLRLAAPARNGRDFRFIGWPFRTHAIPLAAGRYTFSVYAKADPARETRLSVWFPNSAWVGSRKKSLPIGWESWEKAGAQKVFDLTSEWKRYSFSFDVPESMPVFASMGADSVDGGARVWIDGLQLEAGSGPTAFVQRPVAGRLVTSREDNFLEPADPVDARLILSARAGAKGQADIVVKDFFGEERYRGSFPFAADDKGMAEVILPLNGVLPRGIFVLKAVYRLDDGAVSHDFHRFAIMDFLKNEHRLKLLFAENYGDSDADQADFSRILDRYRKIGIGGKNHTYRWDKETWDEYARYGIGNTDSTMYSIIAPYDGVHSKVLGFALAREPGIRGLRPDDPRILLRDFHFDAGGEITPEWLEKFRDTVAMLARERPWIPMWAFGIEIYSKFPVEWWSKDGSPENAYRNYAIILKAFTEGVKRGNPQAMVYQDAPSNMAPERGILETDHLLGEVNKLGGVRFDWIGIHNYRKSPESPDLDADTQTFLRMLERQGYGDTPIFWPEGMHYGPYSVPQWGIESASWLPPSCWYYGTLSYDMGWTEKISAAWRARSWLVALKYQDRVKSFMSSAARNNLDMDLEMTPFATQKVSNTLGRLLGDAVFRKDIRFAPYLRCYVFEDADKRPVAAIWCHHPKVDAGTMAAPEIAVDLGSSPVEVFDLMEERRDLKPDAKGVVTFPVSSFPIFFRGLSGSLDSLIHAFENAALVSGDGISPLVVTSRPVAPDTASLTAQNALTREFVGEIESGGTRLPLRVPAAGNAEVAIPLAAPLAADRIREEPLRVLIRSKERAFPSDQGFRGFLCLKAPGSIAIDGDLADWTGVPEIPFSGRLQRGGGASPSDSGFSGWFKTAWTPQGFYLAVKIVDDRFVVKPFSRPADRWNNDSLQVYFDTFADARSRQQRGLDENDYDYAIHPGFDGKSAEVFRRRSPDPQLALATSAPPDNALAPDIPAAFRRTGDGYVYEVFFPAKYLLPAQLVRGHAMGFGLTANDRDDLDGDARSALTVLGDGQDCSNQPHLWPVALLWED